MWYCYGVTWAGTASSTPPHFANKLVKSSRQGQYSSPVVLGAAPALSASFSPLRLDLLDLSGD